jgi:hypothetical protein
MMMTDKPAFEAKAHEWAVQYADAIKNPQYSTARSAASFQAAAAPQRVDEARYCIAT